MLNILVFSKDRACQLDLTLTTYKKYFKEWKQQKLSIIYKYSSPFYQAGYDLVKKLHPEFTWVVESNFQRDTINAFNMGGRPYTSLLVDDDVFVDNFSLADPEIQLFFNNKNILCVSPRLAPYVNYCYTQNQPQPQPIFNADRTWNWNGAIHDWGYPMSIASFHIFRTEDISRQINTINYVSPSYLEGVCLAPNPPLNRPLMICYEQAKCICSTNNRVQNANNNRTENNAPLDVLNTLFISGKRLNPDKNHQYKLNMCHGPLSYEMNGDNK